MSCRQGGGGRLHRRRGPCAARHGDHRRAPSRPDSTPSARRSPRAPLSPRLGMKHSLVLSGAWRARWLAARQGHRSCRAALRAPFDAAAADLHHARQDAAAARADLPWHAGGRGAWCAVNPVGGPASKPISQCAPARAHACIGAGGPARGALAAYSCEVAQAAGSVYSLGHAACSDGVVACRAVQQPPG